MPLLRIALLTGAVLSLALAAPAAERPRPADAQVLPLLEEALRSNHEAVALREAISAARARVGPAGALGDPTVSVEYQNGGWSPSFGSDEDSGLMVSVEQPLGIGGRRRLLAAIAMKSAEELDATLLRFEKNLDYAIRRAYADLLLAREWIALYLEQERTWGEIEAATRVRYSAGMGEQQDVLRAQAERTRLVPMRAHEEGNEESALAALNRLLGREPGTPLETPVRLAELAMPSTVGPAIPARDEVLRAAEEASPELAASSVVLERARLTADLSRRMLKPDLSAMSSFTGRGALPPMWSLGVGVTLPVWARTKQRQGIVEAEALLRGETAEREALRLALRVSVERDWAELKAAVREAAPYASGVLVQDRLVVDAARASYETGKSPFVSMLEALSTLFADARSYAEHLAHILWFEASLARALPAERIAPRALTSAETGSSSMGR